MSRASAEFLATNQAADAFLKPVFWAWIVALGLFGLGAILASIAWAETEDKNSTQSNLVKAAEIMALAAFIILAVLVGFSYRKVRTFRQNVNARIQGSFLERGTRAGVDDYLSKLESEAKAASLKQAAQFAAQ